MTVSTVASAVNHAFFCCLRNLKFSCFIFIQRPEVVLLVKICLASRRLVLFEFPVTVFQKFPIAQRLNSHIFLLAGRAVSGKCKDIRSMSCNRIDNVRNFVDICTGHRRHNNRAYPRLFDTVNLFQCNIKASRFPEPVVRFSHSVQGKLIFLTAIFLHLPTVLII